MTESQSNGTSQFPIFEIKKHFEKFLNRLYDKKLIVLGLDAGTLL
jgi:hypothetical protein